MPAKVMRVPSFQPGCTLIVITSCMRHAAVMLAACGSTRLFLPEIEHTLHFAAKFTGGASVLVPVWWMAERADLLRLQLPSLLVVHAPRDFEALCGPCIELLERQLQGDLY